MATPIARSVEFSRRFSFFSPRRVLALVAALALFEVLVLYKLVHIFSIEHVWWVKIYIFAVTAFLLSRLILALFYHDKHEDEPKAMDPNKRYPSVTFVIPVKNEEAVIHGTINAALASAYPAEITCIVVDDGSTDDTPAEILRAQKDCAREDRHVEVLTFAKNQGKREALRAGIKQAKGELVAFVDSDTYVKHDALRLLAEHFMTSSRLGAIAGKTGVINADTNLLTRMQACRYGISFDIFKACESLFSAVTCCPGCFSVYRRDALLKVVDAWSARTFFGSRATFGDDRSLTNAVSEAGFRVAYCRAAQAMTVVPDTYQKFLNQQLRWKKSWIREGVFGAAAFMWKKHPFASLAFYVNLILPFAGPLVVLASIVIPLWYGSWFTPLLFVVGIIALNLIFGLYDYVQSGNKYWMYAPAFGLFYAFVMVWQMPWAIARIMDSRWGTR